MGALLYLFSAGTLCILVLTFVAQFAIWVAVIVGLAVVIVAPWLLWAVARIVAPSWAKRVLRLSHQLYGSRQ